MKNIRLARPITPTIAFDDMTADQKKKALNFLTNVEIINGDKIEPSSAKNNKSVYGSEAVSLYRKTLGLPDVSVRELKAENIISVSTDFEGTVLCLDELEVQNRKLARLMLAGAPIDILMNEYRALWERTEAVFRKLK